jgi:hypothetical protein
MRALTMLNERGDVTIVWTEENDAAMEAIIEKKMAEGVVFFIIEPRFGGVVAPSLSKLKDAADARRHRALSIPDEHLAAFVGEGKGVAVPTPDQPVRRTRKTKSAKEAATSETVAVRPMRGG